MVLFFSFASLTHDKLSALVGDVKVIAAAILPGHTVSFGGKSKMHGGSGVASLTMCPNKDVLGIVLKMKKAQLELLDITHECHLGMMQRVSVTVDDGQNEHEAYTYILRDGQPRRKPSQEYKEMHKKLVHESFELYRQQNILQ